MAALLGLPEWQPAIKLEDGHTHRIVLEGGSIDVNGAGILLTTEECQLSEVQQRNPGVSREQLEKVFHDFLGVGQTIWQMCIRDSCRGIFSDPWQTHANTTWGSCRCA